MRKTILLVIVCSLVMASFIVGYRYATYVDSKKLHIVYANMVGSHITETNLLLNMVQESGDVASVRREVNESVLVDIGCSTWLDSLLKTSSEGLEYFSSGVKEAFSVVGTTEHECVRRLRKEYPELVGVDQNE